MTSYLSRTHPSEVIQTPPIPWDPYTQVLMPWGHVLQGLGLWLTQGPQACGPSERTCWSYPMNHGNSRHFSVLGLGLGTGNTGLPLFPTLRAWWEHSHLTIPSQYRVATWQEYLIMSKVLGTPRRKRYFFCLREKASGKRELFNCVLKEFAKKNKGKDIRKGGLGPLPQKRTKCSGQRTTAPSASGFLHSASQRDPRNHTDSAQLSTPGFLPPNPEQGERMGMMGNPFPSRQAPEAKKS